MKHLTIFLVSFFLLTISCPISIVAQDVNSCEKISETTVEKFSRAYLNLDTSKWSQMDDEWLFKDQSLGISPLFYTYTFESVKIIESNDGTKQSTCKKEIKNSSGYYTTTEPEWYWNKMDTAWYYKNQKIDMYPQTFTEKVTEITENSDCNENTISTTTIDIQKDYVMSSNLWQWDDKRNIWLFEKKKVNKLPKYHVVKSIKTQSSI